MSLLEGRRIALIGGAGFIGHNLALRLKELGAEVFILDSLAVNNYYSFKNNQDQMPNAELYLRIIQERLDLIQANDIPLIEIDARDYHKLCEIIHQTRPDTMIQLAAVAHAGKSNKDPHTTFDHSLRTLENALDIARWPQNGIRHFIYFSSSMVYGNFMTETVSEESPCEPLGIYGALKFAGEKIVIAYQQVFGLPYTIIRPSALYGERCVSRRVGQIFIESALAGLDVTIEGDGSDRLDFTYVADLAEGIVKVLTHEKAKNQILNLTYGQSRSINEMVEILKANFPGIRIHSLSRDNLMPSRGTLSIDKARGLLGYEPQYSLEKGFLKYIDWYRKLFQGIKETHHDIQKVTKFI